MSNPLEPLLNEIIARLERGVPPWRQPWANGADPSTPLRSDGQPFSGSNAWPQAAGGKVQFAMARPSGDHLSASLTRARSPAVGGTNEGVRFVARSRWAPCDIGRTLADRDFGNLPLGSLGGNPPFRETRQPNVEQDHVIGAAVDVDGHVGPSLANCEGRPRIELDVVAFSG